MTNEPVTADDVALQSFTKDRGTGAAQFRFGKYYVIISVHRVTDKKHVARYIADYGIERPSKSQTIKALGFKITVDDKAAEIFRVSKNPIEVGSERWAFSIKPNSIQATTIYGVSLQVYEADTPNRVDFNTRHAIDAAMDVYRRSVEQADFALRKELMRIAEIASKEHREPSPRPEPPLNPNKAIRSEPKAVKTTTLNGPKLVVFKRR